MGARSVPIQQLDPDDGELIATHGSMTEAAEEAGVSLSAMSASIIAGRNAGGFRWRKTESEVGSKVERAALRIVDEAKPRRKQGKRRAKVSKVEVEARETGNAVSTMLTLRRTEVVDPFRRRLFDACRCSGMIPHQVKIAWPSLHFCRDAKGELVADDGACECFAGLYTREVVE